MGEEVLKTLIICGAAVVAGVLAGNGAVYFFNKMPGTWLVDYGEEPDEELLHPTVQRVKSTPWKYLFTGFFIVIGIKMAMEDPMFAVPAILTPQLWQKNSEESSFVPQF